jgi:hypothetical protein
MLEDEMCKAKPTNDGERALCFFRFFVYREYREIRHLGDPDKGKYGRYDKFCDRYDELYELDRKSFARLWHQIAAETHPDLILKPFNERTSLTLQQVEEAFWWGEWYPFDSARKNYGGPKHADIASHTIRLGDAITADRWLDLVPHELAVLGEIQHNGPRPARLDYKSLLEDLISLNLSAPQGECCLVDAS